MTLINDYTYQAMTDQRKRDFARVAENDTRVRLALSGRQSWLRRVLSRRGQGRIAIAASRSENRGMATPQHRVAH